MNKFKNKIKNPKFNHKFKKEIQWILREKYAKKGGLVKERDVVRLEKGEPVDYIIGSIPFLNVTIDLSRHPLIPRPETEFWTLDAIEYIKSKAAQSGRGTLFTALDIFAGSGCVGIAVLKTFPGAGMDFSDQDSVMLDQAKINAKQNGVLSHTRFIRSGIFQNIAGRYDYIFANPPYVSARQMQKLPDSVKNFEPHGALYGGEDGMLIIRTFLHEFPRFLKKGGAMWMEFGAGQKGKIEKILRDVSDVEYEFLRDQYGRWRVLRAIKQ